MKNSYRIVRDHYCGYEVQIKKWWFPLMWFQCEGKYNITNTFTRIEDAERHANLHSLNKHRYRPAKLNYVVKNLGKLPP